MRLTTLPFLALFALANASLQQVIALDHELISLHKSLVETESISGNETAVGQFLAEYLAQSGFTVETQTVGRGRENIYAYFGETRNTSVLLTSHIDTVPPYIPYYVFLDRIYGRGSCDAKGSVAAQVIAAKSLYASGEIAEGDLSLLFVVGEEVDGAGMAHASEQLNVSWNNAVFGEPTELKLGVGHKGVYHLDIAVEGKASHSGYPQLGIDANKKLIDILYGIEHAEFPKDDLLGNTTVNVGLIHAGTAGNVVSPHAFAKVLIRVANNAQAVHGIVQSVIDKTGFENVHVEEHQLEEPVYLDYKVPGFNSTVLAYFTDVPNLKREDMGKYLYGPGSILVAHGDDEYVTVSELQGALDGYKDLVRFLL